jgi:hypothetical protein
MITKSEQRVELPRWLRDAFEAGEPMHSLPDQRRESRRVCAESFLAQIVPEPEVESFLVRGFNLNHLGLGFIAPCELKVGRRLKLTPADDPAKPPACVRVVHCTKTAQGYKIGCEFEST